MKLVPALFVLVSSLLVTGQVAAETWSKQLTPGKTSDGMYSFTIKVDRLKEAGVGEFLQFHVTVKGKDIPELPNRSGELRIVNGKEFITSCDVRPTGRDGERSFSFRVAAKYAEKSTFRYAQTGGDFGHISYWFYLKDFVESKVGSRLIGHWKVVSVKASGKPRRRFTNADQFVVSRAATFGTTKIPSRIQLLTDTGRILVFDYVVKPTSKPQAMDLVFEVSGKPVVFPAIFVLDADKLRLCIGTSKDGRPETFAVKDGADRALLILQRQEQ